MSQLSSGSTGSSYIRGIPRRCSCGHPTTILKSTTERNPGRKFYRCTSSKDRSVAHVFKWAKESQLEEYDVLSEKQEEIGDDIVKILDYQTQLMDTINKLEEKTKTLQSEVQTLKRSSKNIVICIAIVVCVCCSLRLF